MKPLLLVCSICLAFGVATPVAAQDGFVYGQVILANHEPPDGKSAYIAHVKIRNLVTGKEEGRNDLSGRDVFGVRVSPDRHDVLISTGSANYMPDKRLCHVEPLGNVPIFPPIRLKKSLLTGKNLKPQAIGASLTQQAAIFGDMGRLDLLQWNIAEYHVAYRNHPALLAAVTQFEKAHSSEQFMSSAFTANQRLYQQMIAFQTGQKVQIASRSLLTMMDKASLATDIQVAAIRTLSLQPPLDKTVLQEFVDFLKKHTTTTEDPLYRPSRSALARVGSKTDKQQVIKDARSTDPAVAIAAQIAINESNLADPLRIDEVSVDALAALNAQDRTLEAPIALETWTVWENGNAAPGLDMNAFTNIDTPANKNWFSEVELDGEKVLRVDYPEGQLYGMLQFIVAQKDAQDQTINLSRFTELTVEMKSVDDYRNVDVGIKAPKSFDPRDQTKFKRTFTDISTDWQPYRVPLRGEAAQLSAYADDHQYKRLSLLQVVAELAFGDTPKQTFYIRKIYFSR